MTAPALTLSGAYPHRQLDDLCHELGRVLADRSSAPPRLDLTELGSLAPANLSLLLASIAERYPELGPESVAVPDDGGPLDCLRGEALKALVKGESGHWERRPTTGAIVGALVFSARMDVDRFLGDLAGLLEAQAGLDSGAQRAVYFLLYELVTNAVEYSGVPRGAVVVELDLAARSLTLAVADCGMGVRGSLSRNPTIDIPDDLTALTTAVMAARTGNPISGDGMGLFQARWMVQNNGGAFLLRSGDASHERNPGISNRQELPRLHGTLVAARLRCEGPLDYGKMDEALRGPKGIGDSLED